MEGRRTSAQEQGAGAYLNGSFKFKQDRLRNEDLACLGAEIADLGLEQLDLLAGTAASDLEEAVDYGVEVDLVLVRHLGVLSCQRVGRLMPEGGMRGAAGRWAEGRGLSKTTDGVGFAR